MISVIVPVYNSEKYLAQCISSILNSTITNIELILIDDGSTDGSKSIIERYSLLDKRISSYYIQNSGASVARNIGINKSSGEYICFVDSDDYVDKDMFEYLLYLINEYDADVSQISPRRVDDTGAVLNQSIINEFSTIKNNIHEYSNYEAIKYYLLNGNHSLWGHMYKAELFERVRIPESMTDEDMAVIVPLYLQCNKIVRADVYKYNYRLNKMGVTYSPLNMRDFGAYWEFKRQYQHYYADEVLKQILEYCCVNELHKLVNAIICDRTKEYTALECTFRKELICIMPIIDENELISKNTRLKLGLYLKHRLLYIILLKIKRLRAKKLLYGHPGY